MFKNFDFHSMGLTDMEFGSTFKRTTAKILTHSIAGVKSYLVRIIFYTSKKIIVLPLWYYNFFYLTTLCTCFPQFYSISPTQLIKRSSTLQKLKKYLRQTAYVQSFILVFTQGIYNFTWTKSVTNFMSRA